MKNSTTYFSLFLLLISFTQLNSLEEKTTVQSELNISEAELTEKLIDAARKGNLDLLKKLIAAGANVNHIGKQRVTALFMAAQENHTDVIQELIKANADVNYSLNFGPTRRLTPLFFAIHHNNLKIVKEFIKAGANINYKLDDEFTCLYIAIKKNKSDIVKELLETQGIIISDKDITEAQKIGGETLELLKPFISNK